MLYFLNHTTVFFCTLKFTQTNMWEKNALDNHISINHDFKNITYLSLEHEYSCALRMFLEVFISCMESDPFLGLNLWGMYEHKTLYTNLKCQIRKKRISILIYTEKEVHHEVQTFLVEATILCPFSTQPNDTGSRPKISVVIFICLQLKYNFWNKNLWHDIDR